MKKNLLIPLFTFTFGLHLAANAAVPLRWTVETSRATPVTFEAFQGETIELEAALNSYGKPLAMDGIAALYWQTNGMGNAYWQATAAVNSNRLSAVWTPEMDVGAKVYNCYIGSPSNIYHAAFQLRLRPSPGALPNELPLPVPVIDFARVRVLNPPWPGGGGGGTDTNAVRALVDASFDGGTNAVNTIPPRITALEDEVAGIPRIAEDAGVNGWAATSRYSSVAWVLQRPTSPSARLFEQIYHDDMIGGWVVSSFDVERLGYYESCLLPDWSDFATMNMLTNANATAWSASIATNSLAWLATHSQYTPDPADATFSNAVLAVKFNFATNEVTSATYIAATNVLAHLGFDRDAMASIPGGKVYGSLGGLLAALAAAVAWLRKRAAHLDNRGFGDNEFAADLVSKQAANINAMIDAKIGPANADLEDALNGDNGTEVA